MLRVKIESSKDISPTTKLYQLRADEGSRFRPGQFISFVIKRDKTQSVRAYSFCSSPKTWPEFEFCVKQISGGVGTTYLLESIGRTVQASDPQGDLLLPEVAARPLVFLAAGTGVAPVRSQIPFWLTRFPESSVLFVYRFRGAEECLFKSEFEDMTKQYKGFRFAKSDSSLDRDFKRVLKREISEFQQPFFYAVGPPEFVKQVTESLDDFGYSKDDVTLEIWE